MLCSRCLFFLATLWLARPAGAQDPSHEYFTIATAHFRVTFTRPMEPLARRLAVHAERAYAQLTTELHPPRGTIDIVINDDDDFSNGSATPYPSNRIIVYATPPVNELGLRYTTDWSQLVVTHELTHIFHLDRSRGIWQLGQHIFGRSPFLFPNLYSPSWLIEGLAVYEESRLAGEGRIEAPENTMLIRTAAAGGRFPAIGDASLAQPTFPNGNAAYAYGSLFIDYLARVHGPTSVRAFVESSSDQLIPYLIDVPARHAFGESFTTAWSQWRATVQDSVTPDMARSPGWRMLTDDGLAVSSPRWSSDTTLTYTGTGGKDVYSEFSVSLDGVRHRLARRNSGSPTVTLPFGAALFSQLELTSQYAERSDLFVQVGDEQRRLTLNQRLFSPDVRRDGEIIASQIVDGASRLVRVSDDGKRITPLTSASLDTLWSEPRWSHKGDRIVAVRWFRGGVSQVVVMDSAGGLIHVATSGRFTAASPSWFPDDHAIVYTIGDNARNDVYVQFLDGQQVSPPRDSREGPSLPTSTFKVQRSDFGVFEPEVGNTGSATLRIAAVALRANGYRLTVSDSTPALKWSDPILDLTPDRRCRRSSSTRRRRGRTRRGRPWCRATGCR